MSSRTHHFMLGTFECISVRDGDKDYPPKNFFSNAFQVDVAEALSARGLPTDKVNTPYTCLFVNTGDHRVMVDTGAGNLIPTAGELPANLSAAGVDPADVDTVIITHAHPDHVGGTLDEAGSPVFPNARYVIWKGEWEFWSHDQPDTKVPPHFFNIAREQLGPVQDRMTLIDQEGEIVPGISAVATPGHTPGHIALLIESEGERLIHISDVVLYPLHLEHPDWLPVYDILPEQAAESKVQTFNRAADEHLLVFAHHFPPFPNLGHVVRQGEGWQWQPLDLTH